MPKDLCAKTERSSVPRLVGSLYPWVCGLLFGQSFLFEDKMIVFLVLGMNCFILNSFFVLERINLIAFLECFYLILLRDLIN
nr:MAG TPA: hypothetical protein [Caudoviricetes sp.]